MAIGSSDYANWSVIDWSIVHDLLTLNLGRFIVADLADIDPAQNTYFKARCSFVRPSRVRFVDFVFSESVIRELAISRIDGKSSAYRFSFQNASLIEIVAEDCSAIQW